MAIQQKWARFALVVALLTATQALATHAPADAPGRPGPHSWQIQEPVDSMEPVANGWVHRSSGLVASLVNENAGPYAGSPEQAARAYLAERSRVFGTDGGVRDLLLADTQAVPGGIHVLFHQAVRGVAVWRADVVVSLDGSGRFVRSVSSSFDPGLVHASIPGTAALGPARARSAAMAAVGLGSAPRWLGDPSEALWIVRDQDVLGSGAHLAWRVTLPVEEPMGDWEVFLDAVSGNILRLTDQMLYVDGSGNTFDPDPLTTAQAAYGGQYSDNGDGDTDALTSQLFLRTLPELAFDGSLYHLQGPWVYLDDFEAPSGAPVTSPDPDGFAFTRSAQGFEDVNVYFHIDESQRYMQALGFNGIQHAPIHVDSHGLSGADNSHYIPSSNRIAYGEGGVDDAEDADVIRHEYGHAIQNSIRPGWGGGEERAMGEGFGDYWACSYSAGISSYRSEWVFNWDGHNPFWGGRVINSTLTYQQKNGDIYHDGTIWASCWWLIYAECGRVVTDSDMLKLHYYMGTTGTMPQAAAFAMQADKDLYGGLHAGSLDAFFVQRGFLTPTQFDVPILTHTALPDTAHSAGPYPVTVTIASTSPIVAGSVKVKFGTGPLFDQEAILNPTGNPNEWGGEIPGQGSPAEIRYYILADNTATWRGATPRGAEYRFYQFHVDAPVAVEDGAGPRTLALRTAGPNPFRPPVTLSLDLPGASASRLKVYDLSGRVVRTLVAGNLSAGTHAIAWDGRDGQGNSMAAGMYFIRLQAGDQILTRKVILVY